MKNKRKLVLITTGIVIALIVIGIAVYIIIDKKKEREEDAVALTTKEDLTAEFLEKTKVSDFIENLQGELTSDFEVNTTKLGKTTVTFSYKSIRNKNKIKSFDIEVVDTTNPVIYMSSTMTVTKGSNKKLTDTILAGDNCDSTPTRIIEGEYDLNKVGNYNLKYIIRDASGNEASQKFTLKVVEPAKGGNTNMNNGETKGKQFSECIEKYKNDKTEIGIDVSKWQGEIDWQAVKNAGAEFAIIRIGYQTDYDGENKEDEYFRKNIEGATKAGIKIGGYFYSYAKTSKEAEEQADWVVDKLSGYKLDLPIAFDWESWTSFSKCSMSFYDLNNNAKTFIKKLNGNGYKGSIYGSKNYLQTMWYAEEFENVWLAHYTNQTDYKGNYQIWQMCDTGRIAGINGAVDIDIMKKGSY